MRGPNNAMGQSVANGPWSPGKRDQWGMPPRPWSHWDYTMGREPE